MNTFKSPWFYIICVIILVIISGLIWHKCSTDELKNQNNKLLQQLLESSDYQAKKLDDTLYAVKTIETSKITEDIITQRIKEQLEKNNLDAVYASQIELSVAVSKIVAGQSQNTEFIPNPTTIIIRRDNNAPPNNNSEQQQQQFVLEDVCNSCLSNGALRVPFDVTQDTLRVFGYTDTGTSIGAPGTYHLDLEWTNEIKLNILLAQDSDGNWSTLVDSNDADLQVMRIVSNISVDPFESKWWQDINLGGGIGFGAMGAMTQALVGYRITENFNLLASWWYNIDWSLQQQQSFNDNSFYGLILLGNL